MARRILTTVLLGAAALAAWLAWPAPKPAPASGPAPVRDEVVAAPAAIPGAATAAPAIAPDAAAAAPTPAGTAGTPAGDALRRSREQQVREQVAQRRAEHDALVARHRAERNARMEALRARRGERPPPESIVVPVEGPGDGG